MGLGALQNPPRAPHGTHQHSARALELAPRPELWLQLISNKTVKWGKKNKNANC